MEEFPITLPGHYSFLWSMVPFCSGIPSVAMGVEAGIGRLNWLMRKEGLDHL